MLRCILCPWSTDVEINFVSFLYGMRFVITCEDAFPFLAVNTCLYTFCFIWDSWGVRSTRVEILFVSFLACDGFAQHMLRCILCFRWNGKCSVNTCWDTVWVLAGMGWVCSSQNKILLVPRFHGEGGLDNSSWHGRGLFKNYWDALSVKAGMIEDWSTHVDIHCESSLSWEGLWPTHVEILFVSLKALNWFVQHMKSYILFPRWHWRGVGQLILRYIFCPRWHGIALVNTS